MKDRIIEMLERGDEVKLVCIDRSAFINDELNEKTRYNKRCMTNFNPLVCSVSTTGIVMADGFYIDEDEFKYFRIAEAKPTFDDLIDVATQAWKDGVLKNLSFEKGAVDQVFTTINGVSFAWCDGDDDYSGAIDTIRLIYTESFIIKTVDDIFNIKWKDAKALLQNGNDIELDILDGALNIATTFKLLDGATVTQKRGNQCNK